MLRLVNNGLLIGKMFFITELFITTAALAVFSALFSVLLGTLLGLFLLALNSRLRALASALYALPFLLPAFLVGIALLPLIDSQQPSWGWVVLAHVFMNAGFVGLTVAANISGIPKQQLEQASLEGASWWKTLRLIQLPQIRSALVGAGLLIALYSATSYGLVLSLGAGQLSTLETEIAQQVLYRMNFEQGGYLALAQVALSLLLILLAARFSGLGFSNLFAQSSYRMRGNFLTASLGILYLVAIGYFGVSIFQRADFPNGFLLLGSKGAREVLNITPIEAMGNSFQNLLIALVVAFPLAWWLADKKIGGWQKIVLLPLGVSSVVIGLGLLLVSGQLANLGLRLPFVAIAQALVILPLIFQLLQPAIASLSDEITDAAKLDGANKLKTSLLIKIPVLKKPIFVALAFGSLASLGEFGATSFLTFGSDATLSVVMFQLAARPGPQNLSMAMSIAILYLASALLVILLIVREQRQSAPSEVLPQ